MSQWTDAARKELENYFARVRPSLVIAGADAEEVTEDLRRHLEAEVRATKLNVVTEEDVRRLLTRIGAPQPTEEPPKASPPSSAAGTVTSATIRAGGWLLFLGVLLPIFTFGFELFTSACAAAFFDPMPSIWHVLLVALVPIVNGFTWAALFRRDPRRLTLLSWLNGVAIGIGIFYSILYAPLMLPGIIGIIFFGFGLLPLAPVLSLTATVLLRHKLRLLGGRESLVGFWRGMGIAWLVLIGMSAPVLVTKWAMERAASNNPEEQLSGLRWLRAIGHKETLLRACYGFTARAANADVLTWLVSGDRIPAERAREIYFRVTGVPFNSVAAPSIRTGRGAWSELNEWTWDEDHGGEQVGGRIKGLFLHSSRVDTTINADAAWSYTEWTMEFRNDSIQEREARAQILLPPGGVVSRLTLWVNGEEREAAFGGRSQVRQAYQEVAVRQRRDPVLVTTAGPDRVLMQCFPVPRSGGIMKVRLGITAPLGLEKANEGITRMPILLERNFTIHKGFAHSVWAQGSPGMKAESKQLGSEPSNGGLVALRGQLTDAELMSPEALVHVPRNDNLRFAWAKDTRGEGSHFVRQTIESETIPVPGKIVFVVDGSVNMRSHWDAITTALAKVPSTIKSTVLFASDEVTTLDSAAALSSARPAGGQDNLPALLRAWNLAVQEPAGVIVWIHGPQPVKLASEQGLLQAVERTAAPPHIYEILTEPGPDEIISRLDGVRSLRPVLRTGSLSDDISKVIAHLSGQGKPWRIRRDQVNSQSEAEADGAVEGTLHLARLWAKEAVVKLQSARNTVEAIKQAGLYQLVTPVSGAVVLETAQQYAMTGLTPVDPQSVPAVPEPSTWALLVLGLVVLWFVRRRRRALIA